MAHLLKVISLTAVGYFLAGWLGQFFAIPPGYATVIWPASGVAIAAALVFGYPSIVGVFIGSTLVNIAITYSHTGDIVFLVPALIAMGSSLQTLFSYALVRRFVGEQLKFYNIHHVLLFILLAGPVGCLISASVGTSVLYGFGIVPESQVSLNWLSWWLGDSVGVIVTVPWFAVLFRSHFSVYYDHPARVIFALFTVALTTVLISISTAYFELNKQRQTFQSNAELNSTLLSERIKNSVDILYGLAGYIRGSGRIYDYEFHDYSENILRRDRAIKALSINHVVAGAERAEYEARMSAMHGMPFMIKERSSAGQLVSASQRSRYVSVGIIYPSEPNIKALGYDVYSEALRHATIDEAIRLNAAYPTPAITLIQNTKAVLTFLPVYKDGELSALATGLFDINDLSKRVLNRHRVGNTEVYLIDRRKDIKPYIIAMSENASLSEEQLFTQIEQANFPSFNRTIIPVGAHNWELIHLSHTRFLEQPWGTHFVLVAGLCVAGLLGWMLSLVFSHAAQVERQVTVRTKELSEANAALRDSGEMLRQATQEAQEANLAKSRFLANMSHEIRTPLNGMLGSLSLLQNKALSNEQSNLVELAHQSGDALLDLVNDILDLSKIEAGELELEEHEFNLQDLLEDVASLMRIKAQEKGLTFAAPETLLPEVVVTADRLRIRQILLNLLGNAIKFSEQGDSVRLMAKLSISSYDPQQAELFIRVKDTGIGISEGLQQRLFQRFRQADTSTTRRYGGTGLGLAISKELVDAMNGEIGVDSQLGNGASFWFKLPLSVQQAQPLRLPESATVLNRVGLVGCSSSDMDYLMAVLTQVEVSCEQLDTLPADGTFDLLLIDSDTLDENFETDLKQLETPLIVLTEQGKAQELKQLESLNFIYKPVHRKALLTAIGNTFSQPDGLSEADNEITDEPPEIDAHVLLVEDNLTNQIVAKGMLGLLGVQVDVAQHGEEALEKARLKSYDLIFMDCQMPIMDGYQASQAIREFDETSATPCDIPIVALSANAMKGDDELCFAAGMNDHVAKPVSKQRLEEVLEKWVYRRGV